MSELGRFFKAERVKWRKSWVLLTTLLAPLCQVGFLAVILWFSEERARQFKPGFRFWIDLNCITWNLISMPMMTALIAELSWGLEEESRTWDHLLLQPGDRRTHYFTKLLSHLSLVFGGLCLLALLLYPSGWILRKNPNLFMGNFQPQFLIRMMVYSLLAAIPPIAFHTWLSMRFRGFWIGLTAALIGTLLCLQLVEKTAWIQWIPWGTSSSVTVLYERWKVLPWGYFPGSLFLALLLIGLGTFHFVRRKDARA